MIEHSAERKARGAFFTPPSITHFLSSWAVRRPEDRVLEPSCGEADFLIALAARQRELGAGLLAGSSLRGIELHAPSAEISARRMRQAGYPADIIVSDFFDIPATSEFDAVVGNPTLYSIPTLRRRGPRESAPCRASSWSEPERSCKLMGGIRCPRFWLFEA